MENKTVFRLYFIDVIRAFAICMMLQGHFVDGLLAPEYRDTSNIFFNIWLYFRGITAPVFFTVSGFIFMYLLIKERHQDKAGWNHIRVRKGIKRGIVLILTAYLLRTHIWSLFFGKIYPNTYLIDVLHCIGLSLLFLISIYLFSHRKKSWIMPSILIGFTLFLFAFSPIYLAQSYEYLPKAFANYFTQANGSVFTIFPWFGYASFGGFMGYFFNQYKDQKQIYNYAIALCSIIGVWLTWFSYPIFKGLYELTHWELLQNFIYGNHIFVRLGNVLLIFAFFMLMRNIFMNKTVRTIGQNTLSIYIIHYIILYGSFTGFGLYRYFHHQLNPYIVIPGALLFVIVNLILSFQYNRWRPFIDEKVEIYKIEMIHFLKESAEVFKLIFEKIYHFISQLFVRSKS